MPRGTGRCSWTMSPRDLLEVARSRLLLKQPFFGTLALFLQLEEDTGVPTMATDGRRIYYNPAFVEEMCRKGRGFLETAVAHEILHPALGHLWRRGSRRPLKWNVAADYEVNAILRGCGMAVPSEWLYSREFEQLAAEEIYARLPDPVTGAPWDVHIEPGVGGCGQSGTPSAGDSHGEPTVDARALADEWASRVAAAAQAARTQGRLPAGLEAVLEEALKPKVSWKEVLAEFLQKARFEYTWLPPDRRLVHAGLYVPDFGGRAVEEIVVGVDTSGSISDEELSQFLAEVRAIWECGAFTLHIVDCDARVYHWHTVERGDVFPQLKVSGRGGTDFRPVFEEVDRRGIVPTALVYLTDGCGTYPDRSPPYPVLWVLCVEGAGKPPWGRVVRMD